jgi:Asp-tRNA(Asn)/Glu-tRNA(Gln) amidotransferase A subunit family amidase
MNGAGENLPLAVQPQKLIRLYTRGWTEIDTNTSETFEDAIAALSKAGVEIVSKDNDPRVAEFEAAIERDVDTALDIVAYEMKWPFQDYLARYGDKIGKRIHGLIDRARKMSPADYLAVLEKRRAIRARCRELATAIGADAYVTLASSGPAITGFEFSGSRTFIVPGSWLGFPAFSLPVMHADGLPFGLQLLGLDHQDGNLCATANWVMQTLASD